MPLETFHASDALSMGVELELQLVGDHDRDLASGAADLLELALRRAFPGDIKPEMTDSMIEVATGIHAGHDSLLTQLRTMRDALIDAAGRLNLSLCGGGTHPFQDWYERRIYAAPRFQQLSGLYGYLAKQFTVFGQHVHIGMPDADSALRVLHALNRYVPHFIALSASSPFSQGSDTHFDSSRLNSVFAFPLSGRAPFVLEWSRFEEYFEKMEDTGIVRSMKDFYWDIRPKPEYGTIELRVCDTPLTVERAAAIAVYLQALCRSILSGDEAPPLEDDYLVYTYNRFQACRFGLEGLIVHPRTHVAATLRDDIRATLERLAPHADALHGSAAFTSLRHMLDHGGNDATRLRAVHARTRNLLAVVDDAVAGFSE
ncbi:MAG: glutamate--cysteine ligase [Gammaproteobacteria bacterium]|jgi:glutamate---cysteine ligase / carboxylate-amine ligase|nr:glutamate--cysteine ligase [Gammaproteobacteria bacterium]MBU0773526.1 glutamate--cysteine ligase [Gammaproteobacteria bacterium]MBU0857710.1 glutamate--cysteine ligase [Gammaproteobacteria bacterium]MBU1848126.1 glutamate--cysteine ligase [Gammaproteobacteria bacterium]